MRGYGRFIAWMTVAAALCLSPLAILWLIDPAEAAQRLRILGTSVGIYVAVIGPTLVVSLTRDPLTAPRRDPRPVAPREPVTTPLRLASVRAARD